MIDECLLAWLHGGYLLPAEEVGEMLDRAVIVMTTQWPWQVLVVVFTDEDREHKACHRAIERAQQHPWVVRNPARPVYMGQFLCAEA